MIHGVALLCSLRLLFARVVCVACVVVFVVCCSVKRVWFRKKKLSVMVLFLYRCVLMCAVLLCCVLLLSRMVFMFAMVAYVQCFVGSHCF